MGEMKAGRRRLGGGRRSRSLPEDARTTIPHIISVESARRRGVHSTLYDRLYGDLAALKATHGNGVETLLINLCREVYFDEDVLTLVADHWKNLTWERLIELGKLVEEYNLEWAIASYDWESEDGTP